MKNTQARALCFFSTMFNSTVALLGVIFIISYQMTLQSSKANMELVSYNPESEFKVLVFKPGVDLTSQFSFNTKQIFLYLSIDDGERSEIVWSKIVKNGDSYKLFEKQFSNYTFSAPNTSKVVFVLHGNVFPYVGIMRRVLYGVLDVHSSINKN
ncbi:signal peptidase complex subunit 3 [Pancytospora epiphaga]|nr:signal peptidase complex subunit 3 [Pancytospora epiphaga]